MARAKTRRWRRHAALAQCVIDGDDSLGATSDCAGIAFPDPTCSGSKEVHGRDGAEASEAQTLTNDDEFWSLKAVVAKTGLSRSSIYSYVARGIFPRQRRLGPRRVAWLASEVRMWMASRLS